MRELMNGAEAISRAALDCGCDFFAGYPITPATPILLTMVRELPIRGGIAVQAEDEIAAIGMCIGAVVGGRRAMTATSGPGISLYSENLGLAIMGEVPLVIIDCQRMGPATGAATTTAQGDIQFLRWGTSGGYPLIVLAPPDVEGCYHTTVEAFALAERFRTPVIVATDKETVSTYATIECETLKPNMAVQRPILPADVPYRIFDPQHLDNVLPLASMDTHILRFNTSSHDPEGYLSKDPDRLSELNEHLESKLLHHREEVERYSYQPENDASTLLISYGIAAGSMQAAASQARKQGTVVSTLTLITLWPVPEDILESAMAEVSTVVVIEMNNGQYAREIERLSRGRHEVLSVTSKNGLLIQPEAILQSGGVL